MELSNKTIPDNQVLQYLKALEGRIIHIESMLGIRTDGISQAPEKPNNITATQPDADETLEFQIGQFWFAKAGIVLLAIGICFLLTFPFPNLPAAFPAILGYVLAGGILALSYFWQRSFVYLSRYLLGGGLILLYFATLRLHFLGGETVISSRTLEILLLLLVVALTLGIALRRQSAYLTFNSIFMGYTTALLINEPVVLFSINSMLAALAVYLRIKYDWKPLLLLAVILTYFAHFLWFLGNPVLGNPLQFQATVPGNVFFILGYTIIFAMSNIFRKTDHPENNQIVLNSFLNSFASYGLFFLISFIAAGNSLGLYHIVAAITFLGLAFLFWIREKSKFSTFFYAILGYGALSVAIIANYKMPDFFVLLCWQSLLVISTAIWFRSKIIILANFIIFLIILFASLIMAGKINTICISFGIVALLSARILNWKKHRLELKTEFMRNAYLSVAFFIFPYTLYYAVPEGYISLSWMGIALLYFSLSILLKNQKYRWMALFTILLTIGYVLIIGISRLEPLYRIISFLMLGIILLVISIIYTQSRVKKTAKNLLEKSPDTEIAES